MGILTWLVSRSHRSSLPHACLASTSTGFEETVTEDFVFGVATAGFAALAGAAGAEEEEEAGGGVGVAAPELLAESSWPRSLA